jgi:16S rRNA (guanine527-N7)-methyltransferase
VTQPDALRALLIRGLGELAPETSDHQIQQLLDLARLLDQWSARINLTAHRSDEAIVRRLILDAAALAAELPPLESLADLGSGAGFPGLPIAVLRPGCRVTLVESRIRRHHFQRAAARALDLPNVALLHGRAETLDPEPHAAVIAQALARPSRALGWMLPWARPDGLVLLPGAEDPPELPADPRIHDVRIARYTVPEGGPSRTLWLGRRRS